MSTLWVSRNTRGTRALRLSAVSSDLTGFHLPTLPRQPFGDHSIPPHSLLCCRYHLLGPVAVVCIALRIQHLPQLLYPASVCNRDLEWHHFEPPRNNQKFIHSHRMLRIISDYPCTTTLAPSKSIHYDVRSGRAVPVPLVFNAKSWSSSMRKEHLTSNQQRLPRLSPSQKASIN